MYMEIKQIAEQELVKQVELNATILEIFITGSKLFLDRNTDYDYVVICENFQQRRRKIIVTIENKKYDFVFIDKTALPYLFDFDNIEYLHPRIKFFNYLFDAGIRKTIYGGYDVGWSMLDHKEKYLEHIKHYYLDVARMPIHKNRWKFGKMLVHYYIILSIYNNNKAEITEEMLQDIRLLYSNVIESEQIITWIDEQMKI